jgi:cation:H+ antiporter
VAAALSGQGDIAVGNVVGSNIFNVLFILGLSALIVPLAVASQLIRVDVPVMIGVSVLVLLLALDGEISRAEGGLLFAGLLVYVGFQVLQARRERNSGNGAPIDGAGSPVWLNIVFVVVGLAALALGSRLLVTSAVAIAKALGMSELVVGLTIVAAGTSLPEVATSVLAAIRGQRDLAVGNAIGSNLFNLLAVLGVTAIVSPSAIPVAASAVQVDIPVMIAVAVACLPIFANGSVLYRWEGIAFLTGYAIYLGWLVLDATEHGSRDSYGNVVLYFVVPVIAITIATLWYRGRADRPAELR